MAETIVTLQNLCVVIAQTGYKNIWYAKWMLSFCRHHENSNHHVSLKFSLISSHQIAVQITILEDFQSCINCIPTSDIFLIFF